ncbi:bifunctional pyr operon transcriptional regulator/uracil phosphoribosyltransferase PyrR [Kamptonema cortianum]|nr:bifunctional pyr operon transcriptional regulator/uracil phosphoribosyltransferase PyrR [Geitlerinema splendidum]MDK3162290.1 bifunctional pyr operon transcriptional regulator/uracil phosphoribosyltransferase PyrR [Kamptonema cortianum]
MGEVVLDASAMKRTLSRLAHEILEANGGADDLAVVGVLRRGYPVAKRLAFLMTQVEGSTVPCGKLDVSGHRDDRPSVEGEDNTEIPFRITGKNVVLVDEVIFTGRTIRASMDSLMKHGRPASIQLAVLVDRGHRELPIQPDFIGKKLETVREDHVEVLLSEFDGEDSVQLVAASEREVKS